MVVDILKVGMSGFVFLMATLGYRLIKQATMSTIDPLMLKAINRYIGVLVGLAVLVAAFGLVDLYLRSRSKTNTLALQGCRDSLSRLDTQAKLPNVTAENLKNGIGGHVSRCQQLLENLDSGDDH